MRAGDPPGGGRRILGKARPPGSPAPLLAAAVALQLVFACPAAAGVQYRVKSDGKDGPVEYAVTFGGGRSFEQLTAFCPREGKFVYRSWERGAKPPEPEAVIWDSRSGETVPLYRFDECPDPLPVIPSIDELLRCPFTGSERLTKEVELLFD